MIEIKHRNETSGDHEKSEESLLHRLLVVNNFTSRILTGNKHPKIKLEHLRKIQIWTFGSLVHQIDSFEEVLELEQIFLKNWQNSTLCDKSIL